jgi:hypothetical protein
VFRVRYELDFSIPEDGTLQSPPRNLKILHMHHLLKRYTFCVCFARLSHWVRAVAEWVEAICYRQKSGGFDSRQVHWFLQLT